MHSSPLLVGEPNFIRMAVSKTKFDFDSLSVEGFTYKLIANPRTIGVKYDLSGLSGWKDVASSVDIFVSRPFVINDLDSTIKTVTVLDKNNMMVDLPFKSESELLEEIGEISILSKASRSEIYRMGLKIYLPKARHLRTWNSKKSQLMMILREAG